MSFRINVHELTDRLPDLLDHAVKSGEECIIQRDGQDYAVLISAEEWRKHTGQDHGAPPVSAPAGDQEQRLGAARAWLDTLGPDYRLSTDKQARIEDLLL